MNPPDDVLVGLPLARLRARLAETGHPPYRAVQIARWLYGRGVDAPAEMTDLPVDLRGALSDRWRLHALDVDRVAVSRDGTRKARLVASDGEVVEAVLIPEADRTTLCVSTQVGCPLACSFCATGALGFRRNLHTGEIVDQVLRMRALLGEDERITNVVFMGMGEPLLNLPAVLDAVDLLLDPKAFGLAPRRVTVSTAGLVPRIPELLERAPVNLAVSLHATTDAVRDVLVPLNRRFPLAVLMEALRGLPRLSPRHPVFFEYTLIDGVNDTPEDARRLVTLLRSLPSKLNLIPMNPHADADCSPPAPAVVDRFAAAVADRGVVVTVRRSRGGDIDAACGQLAGRRPGARPGPRIKPAAEPAESVAGG